MLNKIPWDTLWSHCIIEELIRNGIDTFCVSFGSRSTPLISAVADQIGIQIIRILDERSAAFYAQSHSKFSKQPTVLICTSGTAVANYYPAVVEAYYSNIPLIVITADRPLELQQSGANQTIAQASMFSRYTAFDVDILPPSKNPKIPYLLSTIDFAVFRACSMQQPVHINCCFREPFSIHHSTQKTKDIFNAHQHLLPQQWRNNSTPYTKNMPLTLSISDNSLADIVNNVVDSPNALMVIGELSQRKDIESVYRIVSKLDIPVYCDVLSSLKYIDTSNCIHSWNGFYQQYGDHTKIHSIIHIGGKVLSKNYLQFCQRTCFETYIHISSSYQRIDPVQCVTQVFRVDIAHFCGLFLAEYQKYIKSPNHIEPKREHHQIQKSNQQYRGIYQSLYLEEKIHSLHIPMVLLPKLSQKIALFLGNSLPIRIFDAIYCDITTDIVYTTANRGASGIDGIIASAIGFSNSMKKPVVLVIGDQSFLYDMNSLMLIANLQYPIAIIILNDKGGRIFDLLPITQSKEDQEFVEKYFCNSHNYTMQDICKNFSIVYDHISKKEELEPSIEQIDSKLLQNQSMVLEVSLDPHHNKNIFHKYRSIFCL